MSRIANFLPVVADWLAHCIIGLQVVLIAGSIISVSLPGKCSTVREMVRMVRKSDLGIF